MMILGTGTIVGATRLGVASLTALTIGWFVAVTVPVFAFVRWSGAHFNPAVTLAMTLAGRFSAARAGPYAFVQLAGALLGSAVVRLALGTDAHLGALTPGAVDPWVTFGLELGLAFLLCSVVLVLATFGFGPGAYRLTFPGLVVALDTVVAIVWTGVSMNPVRAFAPSLLSGHFDGLWIYLTAPWVAALAAAGVWRSVWPIGSAET